MFTLSTSSFKCLKLLASMRSQFYVAAFLATVKTHKRFMKIKEVLISLLFVGEPSRLRQLSFWKPDAHTQLGRHSVNLYYETCVCVCVVSSESHLMCVHAALFSGGSRLFFCYLKLGLNHTPAGLKAKILTWRQKTVKSPSQQPEMIHMKLS